MAGWPADDVAENALLRDEASRGHWAFNSPVPALSPPRGASAVTPTGTTIRSLRWPAFAPAPARRIDCLKVKCVALTFDDGPVADTSRLLRMLSDAQVRATFFVLGSMARDVPDMLLREVVAGHEIGNHSWAHPQLTRLSTALVAREVFQTADEVGEVAGARPTLVRPPYGDLSTRVVRDIDAPVILWSVDPQDWLYRDADTVVRRVTAGTRPGSIVLLHDIHPSSISAVPRIVEALKDQDFTFVTVSELYGGKLEKGTVYTGREDEWVAAHAKKAKARKAAEAREESGDWSAPGVRALP